MKRGLILFGFLFICLAGCTKEVLDEEIPVGDTVTVSLKFTESPVTIGYGSTKSIVYPIPEDTDLKKIHQKSLYFSIQWNR